MSARDGGGDGVRNAAGQVVLDAVGCPNKFLYSTTS